MKTFRAISTAFAGALITASLCVAQTASPRGTDPTAPAPNGIASPPSQNESELGHWLPLDGPLVLDVVNLARVEHSLASVNTALASAGYEDPQPPPPPTGGRGLPGGGRGPFKIDPSDNEPVAWPKYFGVIADVFYFDPGDGDAGGLDAAAISLDLHRIHKELAENVDHPPRLDDISRVAGAFAQQDDAEIVKLGTSVEQLLARRQTLEDQQCALWYRIALHAADSHHLFDTPFYENALVQSGAGDEMPQHGLPFLNDCTLFFRAANAISVQTQSELDADQNLAYHRQASAIAQLEKTALALTALPDMTSMDQSSPQRKATFQVIGVESAAQDLSDTYKAPVPTGDILDIRRKLGYRAGFQASALRLSLSLVMGDTATRQVAARWHILADPKRPLAATTRSLIESAEQNAPVAANASVAGTSNAVVPLVGNDIYSRIASALAQNRLIKTARIGGGGGGQADECLPSGSILVGFLVSGGNFAGHSIIGGFQPIYLTSHGQMQGKWRGGQGGGRKTVVAKPQYAVGGVMARGGDRLDGFQVIFLRIKPGSSALDPNDSYTSEWLGGDGGGGPQKLAGDGKLVVGVFGGSGAEIDSLGLLTMP